MKYTVNRLDNAAYHHDLCYSKHDDTKTRNQVCDKTMLNKLNEIVNPTLRERIDKSIVGKVINAKVYFELDASIKAKNHSGSLVVWVASRLQPDYSPGIARQAWVASRLQTGGSVAIPAY